jgi:hypothetical protein
MISKNRFLHSTLAIKYADSLLNLKYQSDLFLMKNFKINSSTNNSSEEKFSHCISKLKKSFHSDSDTRSNTNRTKYKMFSQTTFKKKCIEQLKNKSVSEVSLEYGVPAKA